MILVQLLILLWFIGLLFILGSNIISIFVLNDIYQSGIYNEDIENAKQTLFNSAHEMNPKLILLFVGLTLLFFPYISSLSQLYVSLFIVHQIIILGVIFTNRTIQQNIEDG